MILVMDLSHVYHCRLIYLTFCFGVLVISVSFATPFNVEIITLGFLPLASDGSLSYTGPAFQTGIDEIQRKYGEIFNVTQVLLYDGVADCADLLAKCDDMAARYFYRRQAQTASNMTAIIAPGCIETVFTSRLAKYWNIVYITSIYANPLIRNKQQSPTFLSTTPISGTNHVRFFLNLFRLYNWTTVYFITDQAATPFFSTALTNSVPAAFLSIPGHQATLRTMNSSSSPDYAEMLSEFRLTSRVCVYFGQARHMIGLLTKAGDINMTDGNYIYISVDNFLNIKFGHFMWKDYNRSSNAPLSAKTMKSLLIISLGDSATVMKPGNDGISQKWREIALEKFNRSVGKHEQPTPYMFASHAAVEIFGQVLNESLTGPDNDKFDPSNGKSFASEFLNRYFQTKVIDVFIDEVGEPASVLVLQQFDEEIGGLKTVAKQDLRTGTLQFVADIKWPNGRYPPLNRPPCGYHQRNNECFLKGVSTTLYYALGIAALLAILLALAIYGMFLRKTVPENWWMLDSQWIGQGQRRQTLLTLNSFHCSYTYRSYKLYDIN